MLHDDAVDDGQAEPGALDLGRGIGLEQPIAHLFRQAGAVVTNGEHDLVARAPELDVDPGALIFDETDEDRINDSLRIAKTLMPRIMDSVITGVQGHRFDSASKAEDVNRMILDRSVAVLQPYGVVVKTLRIERLGNR